MERPVGGVQKAQEVQAAGMDLDLCDRGIQLLIARMGIGDRGDRVGVPGEALGEEWVL